MHFLEVVSVCQTLFSEKFTKLQPQKPADKQDLAVVMWVVATAALVLNVVLAKGTAKQVIYVAQQSMTV